MKKFSGNKFSAIHLINIHGQVLEVCKTKNPMKGGHRHRRNYWFCNICGKAFKVNEMKHPEERIWIAGKNSMKQYLKFQRHQQKVHDLPF